ncbi:30S ribosomal protein S3 [Candidatus Peregrinibacteria bacterium]|nr:MAG: 30S ribosomal protein S3 [Candidatus Peregrinibacteria bacterium]
MGQKVHPKSLRLKINTTWHSSWFASKKDYSKFALDDISIRTFIFKRFAEAGISRVEIGRISGKTEVVIYTAKPGIIIGRQGTQIDEVRAELEKKYGSIELSVKDVKKPDLDAQLVGDNIARQIERRMPYRRVAKQAIQKAMQGGAKGIKIRVGGRLNGVEIARNEHFKEGNIPLHTFRAIIDYAEVPSHTMYGVIGVKVWIYKGDSFKRKKNVEISEK